MEQNHSDYTPSTFSYLKVNFSKFSAVQSLKFYNIARFGSIILSMIILSNGHLSLADISIYESFYFIVAIFTAHWVPSGITAILSFYNTIRDPKSESQLLQKISLAYIILSAIIGFLIIVFGAKILQYFNFRTSQYFFYLLGIYIAFHTPTLLVHNFFLLENKIKNIFYWSIIVFSAQLLWICFATYLQFDLDFIFTGLVVISVFQFIFFIANYPPTIRNFTLDPQLIIWISLSWPLVVKFVIEKSYTYVDGILVTTFITDPNAFALFRYGAQELPYISIFIIAVSTALLPKLSANLEIGLDFIKSETLKLSYWMMPISIVLMFVSPYLFGLVFGSKFIPSSSVFNIYLLALSTRLILPEPIIVSLQKQKTFIYIAIIELIINITLSILLYKPLGLQGIAFASIIAFIVHKVLQITYLQIQFKIKLSRYLSVRTHLIFSFLLYTSYAISAHFI